MACSAVRLASASSLQWMTRSRQPVDNGLHVGVNRAVEDQRVVGRAAEGDAVVGDLRAVEQIVGVQIVEVNLMLEQHLRRAPRQIVLLAQIATSQTCSASVLSQHSRLLPSANAVKRSSHQRLWMPTSGGRS